MESFQFLFITGYVVSCSELSTSDFAMGSGITIRCEGLETGIHSMLCF